MIDAKQTVLGALMLTAANDPQFDGVTDAADIVAGLDSMGHVEWAGYISDAISLELGKKVEMNAIDAMRWAGNRNLENPFRDIKSMAAYVAFLTKEADDEVL